MTSLHGEGAGKRCRLPLRALLWSLLTNWPWARVRGYFHHWFCGDEFGLVLPRWYES